MRAETVAERRQFYAIATCAVPVLGVGIAFVPLSLVYGAVLPVAVWAVLVLAVGGGLVVRVGRSACAGLFVGAVLGVFAVLGGLLGSVWLDRWGAL